LRSLDGWIANKQYAEIASELATVLNVLQLFEDYKHLEQVKNLIEKVEAIKDHLSTQLTVDLKQQFKVSIFLVNFLLIENVDDKKCKNFKPSGILI
jgi:hypothetical protein